ncbi:MAG: tyrosine-type recombinase/integrase [Candidatus Korobacteraceae bacterium]
MKNPRGVFEKEPGSSVWWVRYFDAEGRKRREKVGTKSNAIKLYHKRKAAALEGKKLPEKLRAKPVAFSELIDLAIAYSKAHNVSHKKYEPRFRHLREWFGSVVAETIRPADIERVLNRQAHWKPATFNRYRALLSLCFRLGIENGKTHSNPARLVKQRRENNARLRFLAEDEETKLRAYIFENCPHHLPEFEVALNTGLRMSEQYGLKKEFISFERRTLTIPRSKHGEIRHVPLNDAAMAALQAAFHFSADSDHVFLNRYGLKLSKPREWFEKAVKKAGIAHFTWHCLRHTFASRLVMAGVDLRTVQELMGHKTIAMTCRYAHLAPQHQLAAVQKLCDTSGGESHGHPGNAGDELSTENQ